jgi:pimeloyl-ACP methyl ester carboxylesterase
MAGFRPLVNEPRAADGAGEDAAMAHFTSYDGTKLAFRRTGAGHPLVCLPGGPGRTPDYLGDLGGLGGSRELILPDTRGTGASEAPVDPATYRCDRLARDVEALRAELGLERIDLLGHSAGGNVALSYAAAYPDRIGHLVLLSPGLQPLGLDLTDAQQQAAMRRRSAEPWYSDAQAAIQAAEAGADSAENRLRYMPFFYGRWDDAARAHAQVGVSERARAVQAGFYAAGAFDPPATRAGLARVTGPVMMYVGEVEIGPTAELAAEAAGLFPGWELTVQPGAGHYPWLDDPARFTATVLAFLGTAA